MRFQAGDYFLEFCCCEIWTEFLFTCHDLARPAFSGRNNGFPVAGFSFAGICFHRAIIVVEECGMIAGNMADFSITLPIRFGNNVMRIAFIGFRMS
jgi:hypothetical protein